MSATGARHAWMDGSKQTHLLDINAVEPIFAGCPRAQVLPRRRVRGDGGHDRVLRSDGSQRLDHVHAGEVGHAHAHEAELHQRLRRLHQLRRLLPLNCRRPGEGLTSICGRGATVSVSTDGRRGSAHDQALTLREGVAAPVLSPLDGVQLALLLLQKNNKLPLQTP
eukprot:scaffold57_cov254-Pinguiococcus_pyrenoidosus.AAC.53